MRKFTKYSSLVSPVNYSVALCVNRWRKSAQEWLIPPVCTLCGNHGDLSRDLCSGCAGDLPVVVGACIQCGASLSMAGICGKCQHHPPAYDATRAAFHYRPPLDKMIKRLKFNGDLYLARLLGGLMADSLNGLDTVMPDIIVPVPLHYRRLRERGFNQALELARPIAERLRLPLDWRHVLRTRATDPQSELPAKLRSRNIKGAFSVVPGLTARHVAIVDDVMTTGHTVNELASVLRRSGVKSISVWVCARAVFGS